MKIIFVSSGNKAVGTVSPFVRSQFNSLAQEGLDMSMMPIVGHGLKGYLSAITRLRKQIRKENVEIVHAHYSICGIVTAIAACGTGCKVVVSILGSFPHKSFKLHWVRFCIRHVWDATLVKSQRTADQLGIHLPIIPNGVNLNQFEIIEHQKARSLCGFSEGKKYIIWCSNPARPEKNYALAESAWSTLHDEHVVLVPIYDKPHDEIVRYMCAADLLLLTSTNEGSPNVIKEAMSCNCPIVSTDVGDVKWVTGSIPGTYVAAESTPECVAGCLASAVAFGQRTEGRKRIVTMGLDTESVAKRIIQLYQSVLKG